MIAIVQDRYGGPEVLAVQDVDVPGIRAHEELLQTGRLTPAIDRTFPLASVPEAIGYLETGEVAGKVAIALT